jgi:AraC-like DNA-binding protein
MSKHIHREITPLKDNDCFLIFDRKRHAFTFPIHFHPEFEITYINNAKGGKRIVGDHISEISDYELVMIGPNLYHGWENYNNNSAELLHEITIQFPRELLSEQHLNRNILRPIMELFNNANRGVKFSEETIKLVEPKLHLLSQKRGFDSYLVFLSLLYDLAIARDQQLLTNMSFQRQSDFHNSERIEKIYAFVKEKYTQKIKLEEAAKLVNMSEISFSRLIKQRTGKTFIDFVNEIRIGYATRSLIESNKSIGEICFDCGFNNLSNFNRIFKKRQGCNPSEFRKNFTGTKNVL